MISSFILNVLCLSVCVFCVAPVSRKPRLVLVFWIGLLPSDSFRPLSASIQPVSLLFSFFTASLWLPVLLVVPGGRDVYKRLIVKKEKKNLILFPDDALLLTV